MSQFLREIARAEAKAQIQPQIEIGTVGWESQASHFDKGDLNGVAGDRHTLVRVTLYRGKDPTKQAKEGIAQGHEILACIADHVRGIPRRGALVYMMVPHGMESLPGAAIITAVRRDDPERLEDDREVMDLTGRHLIIKAKSIALEGDDGSFLSVGTPRAGGTSGVTIQAADGSGAVFQTGVASMFVASDGDAKSLVQLTPSGCELMQKDSGFVRLKGGEIVVMSKGKAAYIAANTFIGRTPVGGGPAAVWNIPPAALPAPSTCVFIGVS